MAFVALLISAAAVWGADVVPSQQRVEQEVARLSSARWLDRREAVGRLIQIGPSAELRLRRLLAQKPGPEVRLRAEAALRQITGMRRTQAAVVTLNLRSTTPKDAFEQVAEIEGAELRTEPADLLEHLQGTIDVDYANEPYWQVVLDLCRRTGLRLVYGEKGIALARSEPRLRGAESFASSGPFLLRAKLIPWSEQPDEPGRSLRLEVYGEPRTEVLRGEWKVELEEASDQDGKSLVPQAESGINLAGAEIRTNGAAWTVPLRPSPRSDVILKRCKGKLKLVLAQGEQTVEFPGTSGDRSLTGSLPLGFSSGWMTASVLRVLQADRDYEMDVQLAVDPTQVDFDALLASMQAGRFRTFDADGHELELKNLWRDGGGPMNNIRCRWGSKPGEKTVGAPFKLVWQVPTKTIVVPVPFELHDVKSQRVVSQGR